MRVGLKPESKSRQKAEEAGFTVGTPREVSEWADVIVILAPDQHQRTVYADEIKPVLADGKALLFSHGFNIRFDYIQAPEGVDVILVAPKGPGHTVRREYEAGRGVPVIAAVEVDASGKAWDLAWSYASAIGGLRSAASRPRSQKRPRPTSSVSRQCSAAECQQYVLNEVRWQPGTYCYVSDTDPACSRVCPSDVPRPSAASSSVRPTRSAGTSS